ncbi:hypothetical protein ACJQWK_03715 [Exserohilum turcicum]|uniref:RING-type domain-containing protein n=1 Tax=Exserohilum turcicum (strain 28A) TaxID=671987 RepID=R0J2V3_EXST2|nr:uncharacterized protein SETTUDRAFT_152434 [Exserohilum turcica Et28A]EOA91305.1 hypothetical protein SETTUDRAFT_152434 [Exserohilum turcica Et28A]
MASNSTETETQTGPRSSTLIVAIVVPSVLIVLLLLLILVGLVLPRLVREEVLAKEKRWKTRQEELDGHIQSQNFGDWLASQKERGGAGQQTTEALCAICLEEFVEDAQVRGLRCSHAFHTRCLDEWFTKYNEYCPLCHGAIIPGPRRLARTQERVESTIPVMLVV